MGRRSGFHTRRGVDTDGRYGNLPYDRVACLFSRKKRDWPWLGVRGVGLSSDTLTQDSGAKQHLERPTRPGTQEGLLAGVKPVKRVNE